MGKYIFFVIIALWILACSYIMLTHNAGTRFLFIALLVISGLSLLSMKLKRGKSFWHIYGFVMITLQWVINIGVNLGVIIWGIIKCSDGQWISGLALILLGPMFILWIVDNVFSLFMIPALAAISSDETSSCNQKNIQQ